ncbi:MAG: hypothetical protein IB618_04295 [Candidatus Pacearchaeota archaeon]|nr:MAG: hypothetical protein IB618_04295 [Candidatus Pacearchaeota archaeon]
MVISKKIDHRKRKKRENFFGIPFLPLAFLLLLLIVLFLLPPIKLQTSGIMPSITGKVVDDIYLEETTYRPDRPLEGGLNLRFYWGDLIPQETNVTFDITSIKCKHFYVCGSDGGLIGWEVYNFTSGKCENVSVWVYGPWDECGEDKYYTYPNIFSNINCAGLGGACCKSGEGLGYFYPNLDCNTKECWDECKITKKKTLIESIALSTTPWKGNHTSGIFNNVNGSNPPVNSGWGFGACPSIAPAPNYTYPVTYAINPTGYIVQQPSPPLPDLTVLDIYTSEYAPQPPQLSLYAIQQPSPTKRLYTKIKNLGGPIGSKKVKAGAFTVVGCWYDYTSPTPLGRAGPIPSNCFFIKRINNMAQNQEMILDMGSWNIQGKAVQVIVDYYKEIDEKNEYNNEMIKYFPGVVPPKPDLVVLDIQKKQYESVEGTKITMKNIGPGSVLVKSFWVKITYYIGAERWENEYQIQNPGIAPNTVFTLDVRDKDITGKAVNATAFVDSRYNVDELDENNNGLTKWLLPYSCENWNNVYVIPLDDIGLKTPDYEGTYILDISLVYGDVTMYSSSVLFEVAEKEPTHNVCQNQKCVEVTGAGTDQCQTNADCKTTCNENWQYGVWSDCIGGQKRRECYDANNCNTTYSKPSNCMLFAGKYYQTESCCVSEWQCDEWSVCYDYQGENVQSMTCEDLNKCSPQNYTYLQLRDCCIEEWDCEWSSCIDGRQELLCEDLNNCGTEFTKPSETKDCEERAIAWWVWFIIILVLVVVILAVLIGTKRLPWFKKKPKVRKYPQLDEYIRKATERGMSKAEIKTKLIETGWPEDAVSEALK